MISDCFRQKFRKGGDGWVFEYWPHCYYNKYLCMMLDTIFQHLGTVQCALFVWLGVHALYLIMETTPYFLFTKNPTFVQNKLEDLFIKYRQYFRIPGCYFLRFLKMFPLFRSCYFCYFCMRSLKIL